MSNWAGGVLTAAGRVLQAKVEAGTTALILTKIKLGDGTEGMDAVDNLTDLVGPKAVLGISSSVADGDHATITGVMLSTQLQAGFWCREWGLFATDPDAGEILYMVTIDAQPEWLPASTAAAQVSATYAMNIAVANATNIEVQIDPAGLVDVEMLQSYIGLSKRSTAYAVEDTTLLENIPAGFFVECTTAGTTGAAAPVITPPVVAGQTIADGTVVWTVRKIASTQDLTNYLPLSGGTMTGEIKGSGNMGGLSMWAQNDTATGARLLLKDKDFGGVNQKTNGMFFLSARDAENNLFAELKGYRDGDLLWAGNDLGGSAIVAKAIDNITQNYIKYASGQIYAWGILYVAGNLSPTISFPISFTTGALNPKVIAVPYSSDDTTLAYLTTYGVTSTEFSCKLSTSVAYVSWFAIGY